MNWSMQMVYLTCAAAGGAVLVIQTVMLIFGGGDHDAGAGSDHPEIGHSDSGEHGHDGALNLLSIRGVAAFLTFFRRLCLTRPDGAIGWRGRSPRSVARGKSGPKAAGSRPMGWPAADSAKGLSGAARKW